MTSYIKQDPFQASALISEMNPCDNKVSAASRVVCELADQDLDYSLNWVDTLDGNARKYAQLAVVDRWAQGADGAAALAYVLAASDDPNYDATLSTAVMALSHHNPGYLEQALGQMSAVDQMTAAPHLAAVYSVNDPAHCEAWVQSLASRSGARCRLKECITGIQSQ